MSDRTMFGSLRNYRQDPNYYKNHMYFQIITPEKAYRYKIFAYMDLPSNSEIYDYVGEKSVEFIKQEEMLRRKSYIENNDVVNETKKVVILSTCTTKDDLQFVVCGVSVD